ncbi:hypothetical protein AN416_26690 [Paraburkholderia caribensis]|nr:hypothetical protein AN416_26690 [Paraburkholderia caribensis]AMV45932.1 hypothetical protein ATN79_28740 [Paraburkholderia caribensis]
MDLAWECAQLRDQAHEGGDLSAIYADLKSTLWLIIAQEKPPHCMEGILSKSAPSLAEIGPVVTNLCRRDIPQIMMHICIKGIPIRVLIDRLLEG